MQPFANDSERWTRTFQLPYGYGIAKSNATHEFLFSLRSLIWKTLSRSRPLNIYLSEWFLHHWEKIKKSYKARKKRATSYACWWETNAFEKYSFTPQFLGIKRLSFCVQRLDVACKISIAYGTNKHSFIIIALFYAILLFFFGFFIDRTDASISLWCIGGLRFFACRTRTL